MSGSWDGTIKIWNVLEHTCLQTISDHRVDVYGLATHPSSPFFVASTSRDSTIRLWNCRGVIMAPLYKLLLGHAVSEIWSDSLVSLGVDADLVDDFGLVEPADQLPASDNKLSAMTFSGQASLKLKKLLTESTDNITNHAAIHEFFSKNHGMFWNLVRCNANGFVEIPEMKNDEIIVLNLCTKYALSRALSSCTSRGSTL